MATISVPFTSGVIADGAIQERHLADGAVSARAIDQTMPVILLNEPLTFNYVMGQRTTTQINLRRVCSRALVSFVQASAMYSHVQPTNLMSFNFGPVSAGLGQVYISSSPAGVYPIPAVFATQNYREAMRLTTGVAREYLDAGLFVGAGKELSAYQDGAGLYGWYSYGGSTISFLAHADAKGILESVWLEGTYLTFAFRSLASSGTSWSGNTYVNIYAA